MKMQSILPFRDENSLVRQGHARIGRIGNVREEYAFPYGGFLRGVYVLHIENDFRKAFIKNSGLHFERSLRTFQLIFKPSQRRKRPGREIHTVTQSEQPGPENKNGQDAAKAPHSHAARTHGGDLAIGSEPAQPYQNSDEHAHRDGVGERKRDGVEENFGDAGQRSASADDKFEDAS